MVLAVHRRNISVPSYRCSILHPRRARPTDASQRIYTGHSRVCKDPPRVVIYINPANYNLRQSRYSTTTSKDSETSLATADCSKTNGMRDESNSARLKSHRTTANVRKRGVPQRPVAIANFQTVKRLHARILSLLVRWQDTPPRPISSTFYLLLALHLPL